MKQAVLLAGGQGTRLASVSGGLPKPLVDVGGRPFIEYVLDELLRAGCEQVVVTASFKWELLRAHLGTSYKGCRLDWSIEQQPLGTGGAMRQAFESFDLAAALVLNADTLFRVDLTGMAARHDASAAAVTIALREVPDVARYGEVIVDHSGRITQFSEKGRSGRGLINGGIYLIDGRIWSRVPERGQFSFERDYLQRHVDDEKLCGYQADDYFIDIGVPEDLQRARHDLGGS